MLENKIKEGIFEPLPDRFSNDMKDLVNECLSVDPEDRPDAVTILNRIKARQQDWVYNIYINYKLSLYKLKSNY